MSIFNKLFNRKQEVAPPANEQAKLNNGEQRQSNRIDEGVKIKELSAKIEAGNYLDIKIGDADAIRIAVPMAKNGERVAIGALGVFGDSSAIDPLIHILRHGNADSRQDAADALGCIGDPKGIDSIIDALKQEYIGDRAPGVVYRGATSTVNMSKYVRYNMVIALGRFGDKKALETLRKALNDHEESVQVAARWAIDYIGASYPKSTITHEITSPVDVDIPALIEILKNISEYNPLSDAELPDYLKFYQNSSFILRRRHVYRTIRALKRLGPLALDPLVQASNRVEKSRFHEDFLCLAIDEIQKMNPYQVI
jgi:HEAT repeat protein